MIVNLPSQCMKKQSGKITKVTPRVTPTLIALI